MSRTFISRPWCVGTLVAGCLLAVLLPVESAGPRKTAAVGKMGQVVDWSNRHVLYPQGATLRALSVSQRDPRGYWNYLRLVQAAERGSAEDRRGRVVPRKPMPARVDWSVSLGAAGAAAGMYPAKYSFDVNATPDCTNDYVVFPIDVNGSATQATIAAFNNLYSGTGTTSCGANTTATILWAYRPTAAGTTRTRTSPILSLDGTKVAFLDGKNPAVFHVLTPTAGQGTVGAPVVPTAAQMANVTLTGGAVDRNSSPFVDYYNDVAYVGTNNGMLFKITGVFHGTPALAGGPWPVAAGTGVLTGPVIDFITGNVFVGSDDGNLYGFTPGGAAIPGSPLTVGSGRANGGIESPPIVDEMNGLVMVSSGEEPTRTNAVVVQTGTASFATVHVAAIGNNNAALLYAGTFNDAYFTAPTNLTGTTSEWFFYVCGAAPGAGTTPVLYRVGFNGTPRQMNTAANATTVTLSANGGERCSPITELRNGVDRIFLGLLTAGVVEFFDVSTTTTPTLGGTGAVAPVAEAGGTSGIIVDNVSAIAQASSIYFTTQANSANCGGNRCGVKLAQGGLQ